jgi:hypothetical protein
MRKPASQFLTEAGFVVHCALVPVPINRLSGSVPLVPGTGYWVLGTGYSLRQSLSARASAACA